MRTLVKELPAYNWLYLGDTARAPYGARSLAVVYELTAQAVNFLFKNNCELLIIACNTASSSALRKIQKEYIPQYFPDKKVLGVLIPAAQEAAERTKNKRVGVIATEATVASRAFVKELAKLDREIRVFQSACPLLVPFVEAGAHNSPAAKIILENYLEPLKKKKIDTLILGCTHYGILENQIRKIIGHNVAIISEARVIPKKLKIYLQKHTEIERKLGRGGLVCFCSTDLTDKFTSLGSKFFGKKIKARKVILKSI